MKLLMMLAIGLAVAIGIMYVVSNQQGGMQQTTQEAQNTAQEATDAYRANQQQMLQQLDQ